MLPSAAAPVFRKSRREGLALISDLFMDSSLLAVEAAVRF